MYRSILLAFFVLTLFSCLSQDYRWQQHVDYQMDVNLNVTTNILSGTQQLIYRNNSPDTLTKVYYHLYYNAFQPGSMMDIRSRTIVDPDSRVVDRISKLNSDEIGYQKIESLTQDGKAVIMKVTGTIMEVTLPDPILPHAQTTFNMSFESQVPVQIRRTGRHNREGIDFSMTQWYPKLAEYDYQGWHAYQYVGREFHGAWGDFDVRITLDSDYVVAATGQLQNGDNIGYGYQTAGVEVAKSDENLTWHFIAHDVIDFAWAADPDYLHDRKQVPNGPTLHFFYLNKDSGIANWKEMEEYAVKTFQYYNQRFGKYPYETYSIIQGGDGGMEYPMCTLINGNGSASGITATVMHEAAHSWFQATLASNESLYAWMDEGFTEFASGEAEEVILGKSKPHAYAYSQYVRLTHSQLHEPSSQHSDHYNTNAAYSIGSYYVGEVFLHQLRYIIGEDAFNVGMIRYFNTWKMRHPEPNDFIRIMEKESGLQLHWYLTYWIHTTKTIDYSIGEVDSANGKTNVTLLRMGDMPMPIDLLATYSDGSKEWFYISMNELLGEKPAEDEIPRTALDPWAWVNPEYSFTINKPKSSITSLEIDPSERMADVDRGNNLKKF